MALPSHGLARSPLARVYALLLLATLFWGGTAVAGKVVIAEIPPLTAGVLRYGAAALLLAALSWRRLPDPRRLRRRDLHLLVLLGALGTFVNHLSFFYGLAWAPAAHGALIAPTTSPIWILLLTARAEGEPIGRARVIGILLGLVGVALVIRPERLLATGAGVVVGDLLFLVSGLSWGIYSVLSQHVMRRMSSAAALVGSMLVGATLLVPLMLAERPWAALAVASASAWLALAYLAVLGTVLAFHWWNTALRHAGPGRAAFFSNLVPVWGVVLAWLLLGERLTPLQILGGLLAVVGVLVCQDVSALVALARRLAPGLARRKGRSRPAASRRKREPPAAPEKAPGAGREME